MESSGTQVDRPFLAILATDLPMVSIVIPAFNESARITKSLAKIDEFLKKSSLPAEVIVVDDGSTDDTAEQVRSARPKNLRLLLNGMNRGKGYSVRQGVLAAQGDYILFTDADLSAPIEEIEKLLDVAIRESADIVIGSRAVDRSYINKHQSRGREYGGIIFNLMVRSLLGLRLYDTQCGFKLFHCAKAKAVFEKQTTFGFGFDPEVLFLANRLGLRIREVPVHWSHSDGSKVKFWRHGVRMFGDLIRIRWNALSGKYS